LTKARRRSGLAVYERFFRRIVQLCEERGLIQGDVVFVDATLSKANASEKTFRFRELLQQRLLRPERFAADLWLVDDDEEAPPRERKRAGRPSSPIPNGWSPAPLPTI
jgi:hypothetical protein